MPIEWTSSVDLHLNLATGDPPGVALAGAIREGVRQGRLAPGSVLPSTRALAAELGLARGTVTGAYQQLCAEGFLHTSQGAPTRVAAGVGRPATTAACERGADRPYWDFRTGLPDLSAFPRQQWIAASKAVLTAVPAAELGFPYAAGHPRLRAALAGYLGRTRGVVADPERVVVCSGYAHALGVLATVLLRRGITEVAFEDPSLPRYRDVPARQGMHIKPVPVDEHGARVAEVDAPVFVVGAAHHLPLGVPLHPARRGALVDRGDALVVEDDYDGEFRYAGPKVGALQALAPEQVVYAGTVSKTLGPGLRLSWLVLPRELVEPVRDELEAGAQTAGVLDQLTLARFIESGHYDTHIRRSRGSYRARRSRVVAALDGLPLVPRGIPAGLHVLFGLPDRVRERDVAESLRRNSVAADTLQRYWFDPRDRPQGIIVGYGAAPKHAFEPGLAALRAALSAVCY